MRSVFISGASTGIGRGAARVLHDAGWRVFAGVRKQADADSLVAEGRENLVPVLVDVTNAEQIAQAARTVAETVGSEGLHGLVNNAGIGRGGPIEVLDLDDLRQQLEVNIVGQIAMTQAFLPLLRQTKGRVVNIGSIGGRVASPMMGPYCASKFGLRALTDSLRLELKPWDMTAILIEPGVVDTAIWGKAQASTAQFRETADERAMALYGDKIARAERRFQKQEGTGVSVEHVGNVIRTALESSSPRARYLVGPDAKMAAKLRWLAPDWLFDRLVGGR